MFHWSKKYKLDNGTLYRQAQDGDKSFEALIVPRSIIPTILINSHHLQVHTGTTKSYNLIKREFFWKGMDKDINKFIQNCNICKQHNLQKQSYSYIHMTPGRRPFGSIAHNLVGSFHQSSLKGSSDILKCMCLLTNYPIAIPIPNRHVETIVQALEQKNHTVKKLQWICNEKCTMCEWDHWNSIGVNPAWYRCKFAMSKLLQICVMCVKALTSKYI